ncbi:MAG: hypothetical protein HQL82_10850 [Magnetococcales bacterium]|nr:hypothetical protein [Magnetococcales bacterium]
MEIIDIVLGNPEGTQARITSADGPERLSPWPCRGSLLREAVERWLAAGHQVRPWQEPPYAPDLASARTRRLADIRRAAHGLLTPSDYLALRAMEGGAAMPEAIRQWRTAVRQASNQAETAVANAVSVVQVAAIDPQWPTEPA